VSPVRFQIAGTDATSGLASDACPAVSYEGPEGENETVAGRCRDRAGNSATRDFAIDYDATPPMLSLTAESGDASVALSWQTSPDVIGVEVVRTPGHGADPSGIVFRGPGTSFVDGLVDNGRRYSYEVRVWDAAGNTSDQTVVGLPAAPPGGSGAGTAPGVVSVPGAPGFAAPPPPLRKARPLFLPAAGAEFLAGGDPPRLSWRKVRRARYYNVQLFRKGHKLLSVWPIRARYQLKKHWTFRGERRRLTPGVYRWVVWPGYGRRAKAHYGKPVVRSTFVIKRRAASL
jgi:hypothetical protein